MPLPPEFVPVPTPVRVVLADDHEQHRRLMAMVLGMDPRITIVAEAADAVEVVDLAHRYRPDVVLLDSRMPGGGGIEACSRIAKALPQVHPIMLTMSDDRDEINRAFAVGAKAYLFKTTDADDIIETILRVVGEPVELADDIAATAS